MTAFHFDETGERPPDARMVENLQELRDELWWQGNLIAWVSHFQKLQGGRASLDWDEVRRTMTFSPPLHSPPPPSVPSSGGLSLSLEVT